MKRSNILLRIIILIVVISAVVFYFFLESPKKPVEWTPENSMFSTPSPEITDGSDVASLLRAIDYSIAYYKRLILSGSSTESEVKTVSFGKELIPLTHILYTLEDFKYKLTEYGLSEQFLKYIKENYRFYTGAAKEEVLFTGYYEADLKGSLNPSDLYRYPLYRTPEDLIRIDLKKFYFFNNNKGLPPVLRGRFSENKGNSTIIPYYTREEIDYQDKLSGKGLEIVWVDDLIDVFFLHIQGSGIVTLDNGQTLRVNYDESNGHPYYAIGRLLVQQGLLTLENVSMQSIRQFLQENPEKVREILNTNPSYIFFREVDEGPIGSIGVPVTPFRSIASDKTLFPPGVLCYVETQLPEFDVQGNVIGEKSFSGFVMNQDTGGAIHGPNRIDLFTGYGNESKLIAGHMKQKGILYFLIKNNAE